MDNYDPKDFLLFAFDHFDLKVIKEAGKMLYLEQNYAVEIEGQKLFKLTQNNQVIAPFSDVEELCQFLKLDMPLNEEN